MIGGERESLFNPASEFIGETKLIKQPWFEDLYYKGAKVRRTSWCRGAVPIENNNKSMEDDNGCKEYKTYHYFDSVYKMWCTAWYELDYPMKQVKRLNNATVFNKWRSMIGSEREVEGELICYSNHSGSLKLYNDGSLYHYKLLIAEIVNGVHTVYDHTAPGGSFVSKTTSQVVNYLKHFAVQIVDYNDK